MKIVLLATDAYGGHGGIALYNRQLATALARAHEVIVVPRIVPHDPEPIPPNVDFRANASRGAVAYARAIASVVAARPDLVICGHVNLLPVACAIAAHPLLLLFGIEAWGPRGRRSTAVLSRRCRAVVAISALTRDRFMAWSGYRGPTFLLPNAVDVAAYGIRPKRRDFVERYGLDGKRVLLTVGRLAGRERQKGFDEVLEALAQLPSDVVYMIAGGGSDAARLRDRASELGVRGRVIFTEVFDESEKPDIYNLADVYVMPSRGEGFGFVFLEAMASGLPAIASESDGGREALRDGLLGTLVDPSNPSELLAAITESLRRGERRIPEGLDHFSLAMFEHRLADILRRTTL